METKQIGRKATVSLRRTKLPWISKTMTQTRSWNKKSVDISQVSQMSHWALWICLFKSVDRLLRWIYLMKGWFKVHNSYHRWTLKTILNLKMCQTVDQNTHFRVIRLKFFTIASLRGQGTMKMLSMATTSKIWFCSSTLRSRGKHVTSRPRLIL